MKNTPQLSWDYVNANMPITVAVDVMGGDHGPVVTVPAVLQYLQRDIHCSAILLGRKEALQTYRPDMEQLQSRLRIIETDEVVEMHEPVATALRNKKKSSLHLMAQQVRDGEAQVAISAGNTGALMAVSRFILKTLPGIERPAIATVLPTIKNGRVYVLDLGANVNCSASQLLQFAWMGSLFASALEEKPQPVVGLLNVGEEELKGNDIVREAAELLKVSGLNYCGFVEGDDLYAGDVDVVVCDGFVGNAVLKSTEGLAKMLAKILREEFSRNWYTRLCALMALPAINSFKQRVDPRAYNGAGLLGLKGVVFKSHGSADAFAFEYAIHRAVESARHKLVEHIGEQLSNSTISAAKATLTP